jgi:hypothetical protein
MLYEQIISRVENSLKTLGVEPSEAKLDEGQYNISKEDATDLLIDVWQEGSRTFYQVMSLIKPLDDAEEPSFFRMLLEENHSLTEACFTLINNNVFIKETIECSAFFSQERALSTISRIAFYSETYKAKWHIA